MRTHIWAIDEATQHPGEGRSPMKTSPNTISGRSASPRQRAVANRSSSASLCTRIAVGTRNRPPHQRDSTLPRRGRASGLSVRSTRRSSWATPPRSTNRPLRPSVSSPEPSPRPPPVASGPHTAHRCAPVCTHTSTRTRNRSGGHGGQTENSRGEDSTSSDECRVRRGRGRAGVDAS